MARIGRPRRTWLVGVLVRQGKSKELIDNFTQTKGHQENAAGPERSEDEAMMRGGDDQTARIIVDRDATPSDRGLGMLRDLCHSYKLQHAESLVALKRSGVVVAKR